MLLQIPIDIHPHDGLKRVGPSLDAVEQMRPRLGKPLAPHQYGVVAHGIRRFGLQRSPSRGAQELSWGGFGEQPQVHQHPHEPGQGGRMGPSGGS
jgi:hypothetical protein